MRVVGAELPFFILMTLLIDYRAIYWFVKYHITIIQDVVFCTQCQTTFKIRYRCY